MPNQILRRRGTESAHTSFTGGTGEITFITDNVMLAIHTSSQLGGFVIPKLTANKRTLDANAVIFANSTTTLNSDANLTWTASLLTVTGDLHLQRSGGSAWDFQSPSSDLRIVGGTASAPLCLIPSGAAVVIGSTAALTSGILNLYGGLTFNGAQTIQTSTGNLTLTTAAGNGNVNINAHGTGDLAVFTNVLYVDQSAGNVGIGTAAPSTLLHVGLAGTTLGTIGLAGNTSGLVTLTVAAAAGTWTMKLPTGVGTAGYQLTDAAGDGITSWAAAASTRESKNILSQFSDSQSALNKILSTKVYNFKYKEGMGTGDHSTEYTGIMADEAPWAMHFNGGILNSVNTFGYTVLSIQALNDEIKELKEEILQLKSNKKTKH